MKRTTKESVQDLLAWKELYVSVSKTPEVTNVIWHIDPASLPKEDDLKRKSPEGKYLKALSAFLTAMVLWGIFWQIHNNLVPQIYGSSVGGASQQDSENALAQIQSNAFAFQGDSASDLVSSVGGRRAATKLLLEVHDEPLPDYQKDTDETSWEGSLGPVLHRKRPNYHQLNLLCRLTRKC